MGQLCSDTATSEHHSSLANGSRPNWSSTSQFYRATLFFYVYKFFDFHWVNLQGILYYKKFSKIMPIIHVCLCSYIYA